ncbi:hypothetical protein IDG46_10605 [Staphylococcus sp. EG-SA-13]|nr:hypothetical protein [Staphylococcus sp. EG-SA-13]
MAKSALIKDITMNKITLNSGLERLYIISYEMNNEKLMKWIKCELNGYEKGDDLPAYRIVKNMNVIYSGINANLQMKDAPLPWNYIPEEYRDTFFTVYFREGIKTIEEISTKDNIKLGIDLTTFANEIYKRTSIQCYSIKNKVNITHYKSIVEKVRFNLIDILLKLESNFGNIDNFDINYENIPYDTINKVNSDINKLFSGGEVVD